MTKEEFVRAFAPTASENNQHPDYDAVRIENNLNFNPEWVDREIARNGHVLGAGVYLYPNGEIIEFYNQ